MCRLVKCGIIVLLSVVCTTNTVQADPVSMPVEDLTERWDERRSPWRRVAAVRIPPQSFDAPAQMAFVESMSCTPWHALPEHRPLGGINRVRREVYQALSRRRHELNGVARAEPSLEAIDALWPLG